MKKVILASFVAMGMAHSAFAVTAQSGVYVGGNLGWSFADKPSTNANQLNATSVSNQNVTWGGTIGYDYAFTQNWLAGVEASYVNFGSNTYDNFLDTTTNTKLANWGIQLMATGTYLMDNGFNAFAKLGGIDQHMTASNSFPLNVNGDNSISNWLPATAIGVGYMPMQNLNVALQYEHTFGTNWDNDNLTGSPKPMTQNALTLGVTYKFGM